MISAPPRNAITGPSTKLTNSTASTFSLRIASVRADQLAALAAVIEIGGFEAAAERLFVTPSAVSQRIKALEQRVGQVLVTSEKPCWTTSAGTPLLWLAAQTAMLESEELAVTGGRSAERTRIAIAVNAEHCQLRVSHSMGFYESLAAEAFQFAIDVAILESGPAPIGLNFCEGLGYPHPVHRDRSAASLGISV
jgi:hypothetical protein